MDVLLATNNQGKAERYQNLAGQAHLDVCFRLPWELGIEPVSVAEDGATLEENAEQKARAYEGKTNLPVLANDTGFFVEGEGFVAAPKRKALEGTSEHELSDEEIADRLVRFWKDIAAKHGGKVEAVWIEAFFVLYPGGEVRRANSRREVVLTDQEHGKPHIHMPVRALYISKATNKPAALHTKEEELLELRSVVEALKSVLGCGVHTTIALRSSKP